MVKCSSLDTRVQPSILNAAWEELNAGFQLRSKLPEADEGPWVSSLYPAHTQAGGEEDPRQFSLPKQSLFYWCPDWVEGGEDRRRSDLGDRGQGVRSRVSQIGSVTTGKTPWNLLPSPYSKDFINAWRVALPALKSRTLIPRLEWQSVQERNTRVSVTLPRCVTSLRPTNPLEGKERSQQAEVDRPCREQRQPHTECLWPVCVRTISHKLPPNYPWVNFPTKWLQTVGTENL